MLSVVLPTTNTAVKPVVALLTVIFSAAEVVDNANEIIVSFDRTSGDESLDAALRVVQQNGGKVIDIDFERSTLLDVLERYEER